MPEFECKTLDSRSTLERCYGNFGKIKCFSARRNAQVRQFGELVNWGPLCFMKESIDGLILIEKA